MQRCHPAALMHWSACPPLLRKMRKRTGEFDSSFLEKGKNMTGLQKISKTLIVVMALGAMLGGCHRRAADTGQTGSNAGTSSNMESSGSSTGGSTAGGTGSATGGTGSSGSSMGSSGSGTGTGTGTGGTGGGTGSGSSQ
jgi:hypothetical protein